MTEDLPALHTRRGPRAPPPAPPFDPPAPPPPPALPATLLAAALEEIDHGILVVDVPGGRLRHANRQGIAEAGRDGTLSLTDGLVAATDAAAHHAWVAALQAAAGGRRSLVTLRDHAPGAGPMPSDESTAPDTAPHRHGPVVSVAVVPLAGDDGLHRQALAVFGRRAAADRLSLGFFARQHGLTPTEDAVLAAVCRGLTPAEVAATLGVALSTVRTHVNAIRLKTGVGSLRELVHKVSTLPPMAPALRPGPC